MIYKLTFLESAKKEWDKLNPIIQGQFKRKLNERLKNPFVPKDKLSNLPNCYKIKLKSIGYRLVYKIFNDRLVIQVVAVGKRDKSLVYCKSYERTK